MINQNAFNEAAAAIFRNNVDAGWWSDGVGKYVIGTKLALVHSEVSEALEGFRKGKPDSHLPHRSNAEVEIADALIRLLDLAGSQNFDIGTVMAEKIAYNAARADHKPENRAANGGKAY